MSATDSSPARGELPSWAVVSPKRAAHIGRVAALMSEWADRLELTSTETSRWLRAAWLHDAMRDADEPLLRHWSADTISDVYLLHGPAAAARASQDGEQDQGVLEAIRWHTVGYADWDEVGRTLYCADFLEPGRTFEADLRAALSGRFTENPAAVLGEVAKLRLAYAMKQGWRIPPETLAFTKAVVS